jgi:hypothetical protein
LQSKDEIISRLATKTLHTLSFDLPIPLCYGRHGAM